ncbi:hypothetical protein [Demequina zhanjiangensis]|uniref:Glycosyl transferase family 2 n=1 Tax=Demequina zhanjiangensis TaxID=3051659 RepID=A0ABT8FYX6_9MICO|nr:hypothetical protein [Demequina sp. SYSU T00b26]MDN4472017.1 hypothetical protein [Demequina sp. SYSU T00b26]
MTIRDLSCRVFESLRLRVVDAIATVRVEFLSVFSRTSLVSPDGFGIVSYTSHGVRASKAWRTAVSIGAGKVRPKRIILWLEPGDASRADSWRWRRLSRRGLEVGQAEVGLGPHNKYFHALGVSVELREVLVTADDDIIYPRDWLDGLRSRSGYPAQAERVTAYRAREVVRTGTGGLAPYRTWPFATDATSPADMFLTGVSGVAYPPEFCELALVQARGFSRLCPKADDVWLNRLAREGGFEIQLVEGQSVDFPAVLGTRNTGLSRDNVVRDANDEQIRLTFIGRHI